MCTVNGSKALAARAATLASEEAGGRCRQLRGGCYGLCDIGPNVIVRRWAAEGELPSPDVDRLTVTDEDNETVYCGISIAELEVVVASHLEKDAAVPELTRDAREALLPPQSVVAAKLRALRAARERKKKEAEAAKQG